MRVIAENPTNSVRSSEGFYVEKKGKNGWETLGWRYGYRSAAILASTCMSVKPGIEVRVCPAGWRRHYGD